MSNAARFIHDLDERQGADTWGARFREFVVGAQNRTKIAASLGRAQLLAAAVALAAISFAAGAIAGSRAAQPSSVQPVRQGACAALHMAAAHGYLDERQQRVVMHALATALNPQADLFSGGYRALREACSAAVVQ